MTRLKVALLSALCCFIALVETTPLVKAPFGQVKGVEKVAQNGKPYLAFLGIPYAKPPLGELRFAKPERHPELNGVYDATAYGASCIQSQLMLPPEANCSEDCLFLNVFVNEINRDARKKVIFWIHGGGFVVGTSFGHDLGSFLTDHDIIVVTVNYRLGVLGFLSTEDEVAPGNYGLWDQILALKWVKENIPAFGGDSEDITISGESAGGSSASFIALSPHAVGLFSKVICHSGTATSLFGKYVNAKADALNLAKKLGCVPVDTDALANVEQSRSIVDCMRSKSAEELSKDVTFRLYRPVFVPRTDGDFLPRDPLNLLNDERYLDSIRFHDKPYLISLNNNEQQGPDVLYSMFKSFHYSRENVSIEEKDKQWEEVVWLSAMYNVADRLDRKDPSKDLTSFVFEWYDRRKGRDQALPTLISDLLFSIPTYDLLNAVARNPNGRVWYLYFNHYPQFMKGAYRGMIHGLDIVYLLDLSLEDMNKITQAGMTGNFSQEDQELKALYSALIAEFVKNGNPEPPVLKELINSWPNYDLRSAKYLDFKPRPIVQEYLDREKRELWEKSVPNLARNLEKSSGHTEL
ncbi:pyrethroid hydrolase Ces2a-like [Biomphalaria glabrata]|uniref:Carboxylic ester hydrolase n=1 Tax=Biomphalaria glabrata TaxID=6526 RepID=A0A9U8DWF8_BIOGL|nr:pyrethroid hydrolase Ces2a-like [Biomphalaria glabrata]